MNSPRASEIYPAALVFGLVYAVWLLSWQSIFPAAPLHLAALGDEATSITGQRYFLGAPWAWPLLRAPLLAAPAGTNVALTDSIPLALLALKPFRAWLPAGASVSQVWLALVLGLQPAAAVFALRQTGERRLLPAMAVALLVLSLPTLLHRYGHKALCTHAAILLALGLYFRLVSARRGWAAALGLMAACLLIHPYILALSAAVLAAVPLTLLLRGDRSWVGAALTFLAGMAGCGMLAWVLGFGGSHPAFGFGYYSMNLLGPFLPTGSSLFPTLAFDATGGQGWEGFQYLGAGVLVLMTAAMVQAMRGRAEGWRRHAGLLLILLGLGVFALSNRVYIGPFHLFDLPPVPAMLAQFRATARFFWPVAYVIVVAGVAIVARSFPPRIAAALLVAAIMAQWVDTSGLRAELRRHARQGDPWEIDAAALRPVFAAHRQLTLWPTFACGAMADHADEVQTVLLASETLMRTNTVATAREWGEAECDAVRTLGQTLQPGELRVMTHPADAWLVPDAANACARDGAMVLCSANAAALANLPPLAPPALPAGRLVQFPDPVFAQTLGPGWSQAGPGGVWTEGSRATLEVARSNATSLTLDVVGLAPSAGEMQDVTVWVNGRALPTQRLPDLTPSQMTVPLPNDGQTAVNLAIQVAHPTRPLDRGMSGDARSLGLLLRSLRMNDG